MNHDYIINKYKVNGEINWVANATSDHDSDGCRDLTEDLDDDNDGFDDLKTIVNYRKQFQLLSDLINT